MSTILKPLKSAKVPPLENGDRLTRAEFERRYAAMPPNVKAELVEGVVYMSSPVRFAFRPWLPASATSLPGQAVYQAYTPGVLAWRTMPRFVSTWTMSHSPTFA